PRTHKSDWIKSLTGSTGTHDNMFVSQQATVVGLVNNVLGLLPNIFRVGQSTFTGVNTRQPTHSWFDVMDSVGSMCHHIGLRCRVLPHFSVHCWSHDDRDCGGEQNVTDQIFGQTVRSFGKSIGSCRSY